MTERKWDPDYKLWVCKLSSLGVVKDALEAAGCDVDVPSARIMDALSAEHRRHDEHAALGNNRDDMEAQKVGRGSDLRDIAWEAE